MKKCDYIKVLFFLVICHSPVWAEMKEPRSAIGIVQNTRFARDWWMPRHKEKLIEIKAAKQIDLVFLGDSYFHDFETNGQEVWKKFYAKRNALNLGFRRDRTEHIIWRLENGELTGVNPKVVVVQAGIYNAEHRHEDPALTAAGIKAILEKIKKISPNTKIILLSIPPRGNNPDEFHRKINDKTNVLLSKLEDRQTVYFINLDRSFIHKGGQVRTGILRGPLHLKVEGYLKMAEAIEPILKKLLK